MAVNPAYCGSREALSASLLYRQQWTGFPGAPKTLSSAIHGPSRGGGNNFGLIVLHDEYGRTQSTRIQAAYAYRFEVAGGKLSFGLDAGNEFRRYRFNNLYLTDPVDSEFNGNSPVFSIPRIGFGTWFTSKKMFIGFSIPELLQIRSLTYSNAHPNEIDYRYYFLTGGFLFRVNPDIQLKPSLMLKYMTTVSPQADINLNLIYRDRYWIGCSYRTGDAAGGMLEIQANDQLRFGYMFEYSLGGLRGVNAGTHELLLRYEFGYTVKNRMPGYF